MKISRFNFVVIGFILVILISPIISAYPRSEQPITVTFWYTENTTEMPGVLELVEEFETAHNGTIDVIAERQEYFAAKNGFSQAYIAKAEPDVFRAARDWVPEFAAGGMIAPLTAEFTEDDLDDFLPIALKMMTYPDSDGVNQIWGFPQLVDTPALMLNRHHFETMGINTSTWTFQTSWTWAEFWDMVVRVNSTANKWYAMTIAGMFFGAQPFFFGNGADMFYNETISRETIAIDSPESRYGLEFTKNLTKSGYTPRWQEQGWSSLTTMFRDFGTAAMISQGPWELLNYLTTSPEFDPSFEGAKPYANASNLLIIQLPHDEAGNRGAPIGGHNYVISSETKGAQYDASIEFAKFMSSEYAQIKAAVDYFHVPSRLSVMESPILTSSDAYPYVKGYFDAVMAAKVIPVSHYWAALETQFALNIDDYLADELTLDECIDETIREWYDIIPPSGGTSYTEPTIPGGIPGYSVSILIIALGAVSAIILKKKRNFS